MLELNQRFLELYKRADRFIRDAYSSKDGITKYIELMEANRFKGTWKIQLWAEDYKMLKRVRRIRNQYAHEVSFDSDLCKEKDYRWLEAFYERLSSASDPLAMLNQSERERQRRRVEKAKKPSVWKRIKNFFLRLNK